MRDSKRGLHQSSGSCLNKDGCPIARFDAAVGSGVLQTEPNKMHLSWRERSLVCSLALRQTEMTYGEQATPAARTRVMVRRKRGITKAKSLPLFTS